MIALKKIYILTVSLLTNVKWDAGLSYIKTGR